MVGFGSPDDTIHAVQPVVKRDASYLTKQSETVLNFVNYMYRKLPEPFTANFASQPTPAESAKPRVLFAVFDTVDVRVASAPSTVPMATLGAGTSKERMQCLILGYEDGVQIWRLGEFEAVEILSLRNSNIRAHHVKFLKHPEGLTPEQELKRPHLAVVSGGTVSILSLKTHELLLAFDKRTWSRDEMVYSVESNSRVVAVALRNTIHLFDARTYTYASAINGCKPSPLTGGAVMSLGSRWLAVASEHETSRTPLKTKMFNYDYDEDVLQKQPTDTNATPTQILSSAASTAIEYVGWAIDAVAQRVATTSASTSTASSSGTIPSNTSSTSSSSVQSSNKRDSSTTQTTTTTTSVQGPEFGTITVINLKDINKPVKLTSFRACDNFVSILRFNPSGSMLAVASHLGREINVFAVAPRLAPENAAVYHLYQLMRGNSNASILDITFTNSSRHLAATSSNGTIHIFPINPMGGAVGVQTHTVRGINQHGMMPHDSLSQSENAVISQYAAVKISQPPTVNFDSPVEQTIAVDNKFSTSKTNFPFTVAFYGNEDSRPIVPSRSQDDSLPTSAASELDAATSSEDGTGKPTQLYQGYFSVTPMGTLHYHLLCSEAHIPKEGSIEQLRVTSEEILVWNVNRMVEWSQVKVPLDVLRPQPINRLLPDTSRANRWQANIEPITHALPEKPVWRSPNFTFRIFEGRSDGVKVLDEDAAYDASASIDELPTKAIDVNAPPPQPLVLPPPSYAQLEQDRMALGRPLVAEDDIGFENDALVVVGASVAASNSEMNLENDVVFHATDDFDVSPVASPVHRSRNDRLTDFAASDSIDKDDNARDEDDEDYHLATTTAATIVAAPDGDNESDLPMQSVILHR